MKKVIVYCLLFVLGGFVLAQSKVEKLQQLKNREDIKVTEVEKDLLKLEYLNGKVIYKNIADYQYLESGIQNLKYSPTFDSTTIDLTTIDTTLYYQKYKFWQEVPITNLDFSHLMVVMLIRTVKQNYMEVENSMKHQRNQFVFTS